MDNNHADFGRDVVESLSRYESPPLEIRPEMPPAAAVPLHLLQSPGLDLHADFLATTDKPQTASAASNRHSIRRAIVLIGGLVAVGVSFYYGRDYWLVGRFHVSTDDAYVQADTITIAPKVPGYLVQVLVGDNEMVRAGQVLARIDARDYTVALDQARADVGAAVAAIAIKQAGIEAQQSNVESARATIAVDRSNQTFAGQESRRYA